MPDRGAARGSSNAIAIPTTICSHREQRRTLAITRRTGHRRDLGATREAVTGGERLVDVGRHMWKGAAPPPPPPPRDLEGKARGDEDDDDSTPRGVRPTTRQSWRSRRRRRAGKP